MNSILNFVLLMITLRASDNENINNEKLQEEITAAEASTNSQTTNPNVSENAARVINDSNQSIADLQLRFKEANEIQQTETKETDLSPIPIGKDVCGIHENFCIQNKTEETLPNIMPVEESILKNNERAPTKTETQETDLSYIPIGEDVCGMYDMNFLNITTEGAGFIISNASAARNEEELPEIFNTDPNKFPTENFEEGYDEVG